MSARLSLVLPVSPAAAARPTFEAVYRDNVDFVWRNAKRLGVPAAGIDDAVQKVFLVVHRRLAEVGPDLHVRAWLFQIVRRVARDERRAVSTCPDGADSVIERIASVARGPEDVYAMKSAAAQLQAILAGMDEERREVFILADLEGFTAPEIAESTATNVNTIYARLRSARQIVEEAVQRLRARQAYASKEGGS